MEILILGATGNTGSAIVKQLKDKHADFGIMTTRQSNLEELGLEADQVHIGNYDDVASLVTAMEGVSRVYLVMPMHPNMVDWVKNVISAAKQANVQHIVKQSGLSASASAKSQIIRDHAASDALIKESGLQYTLIQPNSFFQNFYGSLPTINADGCFYLPLGEAPLSLVDIHDVAGIAVAALTEEGHAGKTHLITGAEALTSSEQAKLLSVASGKTINYVNVPQEAVASAMKEAGMGEWLADKLAEMLAWFAEGDYSQVTDTIQTVLGREPRTFADFAQELAHSIEKQSL